MHLVKVKMEAFNVFSVDADVNLGKQYAAQIIDDPKDFSLLDEQEYLKAYKTVRKIASNITQSSHLYYADEFVWEAHIIETHCFNL